MLMAKLVGKSFEGTKLEGIIPDDVPSEYSLSTSKSQFDLYTNDEHMRSKYKGYDDLSELKKAQLKDIEYHAATDGKYKGIDAKKFTNAYDNLTKVGDEYAINKVLKAVDDVPDGNVDPNMHLKNALTGKTDMLPDICMLPPEEAEWGARIGTVLSIRSFVDSIGDAGDVVEAGTIFYGAYKQYKAGDVYGASDTLGSWGSRTLGSIGGGAAFGAIATTFYCGRAVSAPVGIFAR